MGRVIGLTAVLVFGLTVSAWAADVMTPLDLRQVKVGGELGRHIDMTAYNNLVKADLENAFLAKLRNKSEYIYVGVGKYIDATVRMAAYTGNEQVVERKKRIIDEVLKFQEPDGYIGAIVPSRRIWGLWDSHEMGYIIYALTSDYQFFGERRSLEAARKLADYLVSRWHTKPENWSPFGHYESEALPGFYRVFVRLYQVTGDKRYLDFCNQQLKVGEWNIPIEIGRRPGVKGHAYAFLSHCLAQLELYRIQPDEKLLRQTDMAVDFMTKKNGMSIIGGLGINECWTNSQSGRGEHGETCATLYETLVFDSLLRLRGDSYYGDLIERCLYNAALAAQSPDGRWARYYSNFEGTNQYLKPWDHYCCPNNLRRLMTTIPQLIYYRTNDGVAVDLYSDSQTTINAGAGLKIALKQETDYPTSGKVMLRVDPSKPASFAVQLRIPRWCPKATVKVNGQAVAEEAKSGTFFKLQREWKGGDRVELEMPMDFRLVLGRQRQSGRVALMRGPLVYTLNPLHQQIELPGKTAAQSKGYSERFAKMDAVELSRVLIHADSIESLVKDDSVRPGGTACRATFTIPHVNKRARLLLTEFPDSESRCIYFEPDYYFAGQQDVGQPDELLGGP